MTTARKLLLVTFDIGQPSIAAYLTPLLWINPDQTSSASLTDLVTQRLRQAIALGLLPDGSNLPSEAELAAQMHVSTVTLRASLATLRAEGLIETRRGRSGGSFVKLPKDNNREPLRAQLLSMQIDDIRDARDLHVAIAGQAAYLAAERARGHAIDRLQRYAEAIEAATTTSAIVRADFRFHSELAAVTRSARLTRAEISIQTELTPLLWIPGLEIQTTHVACADHAAIVEAVQTGAPGAARSKAEEHVGAALNGLIELRMQLGGEPT
jgi:DNA-binding FadR family transcriptional regulator